VEIGLIQLGYSTRPFHSTEPRLRRPVLASASAKADGKVLDFGLAKIAVDRHSRFAFADIDDWATPAGVVVGAASYMSEQARVKPVDKRCLGIWRRVLRTLQS